jgi:LacI family transcriptional regulator
MPSRPTLRDVALAVGLSRAAVSMAMRNHPRISAATRILVQNAARELGYHPDPEVSRLTHLLRVSRIHHFATPLALVHAFPSPEPWAGNDHLQRLCHGLETRATEVGFRLERFWLGAPRMTPARMARILLSRGIHGVIFLGFPEYTTRFSFPFENFAAVTIGHSLAVPMHRVCQHHFREMLQVLEESEKRGYRRPGLVLNPSVDQRVERYYRAAFLLHEAARPVAQRIEPLLFDGSPASFQKWWRMYRPDFIALAQPPPDPSSVVQWLARLGFSCPGAVGLALLDTSTSEANYAGVVQAYEQMAASTIDVVMAQLMRGERGLPASPQVINIAGSWRAGATAPTCPSPGK